MQQSKEERVHDVFEKISDKYDVMNSVISFQRHKAWRKETMRIMDVQPGSKALDVSLRNRRLDNCASWSGR